MFQGAGVDKFQHVGVYRFTEKDLRIVSELTACSLRLTSWSVSFFSGNSAKAVTDQQRAPFANIQEVLLLLKFL